MFSLFTSQIAQQLLAFTGILSLGILHGANDLKIIAKQKNRAKVSQTFLIYIGVVLLGIFFFYFFPVLALTSFVGVSCYHLASNIGKVSQNQYPWKDSFIALTER